MLSVILYGRNDSYGYNLHKRAALSLNCMAEVLDAGDDEILFVDYNTPDNYPTFPEAIRDTLTTRTRQLLRVLRVRPAQHAPFRHQTHLATLEPIARNVALRRSNPENRWILSTNTDMIFVPRAGRSLSETASRLDDALYHLPRFEIPETLWEVLDRTDPSGTIAAIARWGWDLHLNEIVYGPPAILYDGPGDFQLATRADLIRIHGFDERMLLGWHVDSNLVRRLGLLRGAPRTLVHDLFGYHCGHTRQATVAHRHNRLENDWGRFVDGVAVAEIPEQSESWGLLSEPIEEIRLVGAIGGYVRSLRAAIGERMQEPTEVAYNEEGYDKVGYDARHVIPFVVDALSCYPRTTTVGWVGKEPSLLDRFGTVWRELGFTGPVLVPQAASWLDLADSSRWCHASLKEIARKATVFVIDFGPRPSGETARRPGSDATQALRQVALWFRRSVMIERRRLEDEEEAAPRRFVAINAVHSRLEPLVRAYIDAPAAPIATRLRQGFVLPAQKEARPLLPVLDVGDAGRSEGASVTALGGIEGYVVYGGYFDLMQGTYRVRLAFEAGRVPGPLAGTDVMILEIVTGTYYLAFRQITETDLVHGEVALDFTVSEESLFFLMCLRVEVRLLTRGLAEAHISKVTLETLGEAPIAARPAALDWLPLMFVGPAGGPQPERSLWSRGRRLLPSVHPADTPVRATGAGVVAREGKGGFVLFGPYVSLLPGRHLLEVDLAPSPEDRGRMRIEAGEINLDVYCLADDSFLVRAQVGARALSGEPERLEFEVPDRPDPTGNPARLEFRVWSLGKTRFMVRGVRTQPIALLPIECDQEPTTPAEPMSTAAGN